MPQTIQGHQLNTITLAADDLVTVNFPGGGSGGVLTLINYGPGKIMISSNSNIVPSFTSTDCFLVGANSGYSSGSAGSLRELLMIADTADTVVTFSFL